MGFRLVKTDKKKPNRAFHNDDSGDTSTSQSPSTAQQASSSPLRRLPSSGSYLSDSSTSEDEILHPSRLRLLKDDDEMENIFIKQRTNEKGKVNDIKYTPQRVHRQSSSPMQSESSTISMTASALDTSIGGQSDNVHLMTSRARNLGASFSSTSSSESEEERSYIRRQLSQSLPLPLSPQPQLHHLMPPPPLLMRNSASLNNELEQLEIKLSLSDDSTKRADDDNDNTKMKISNHSSDSNGSPTNRTKTPYSQGSMSSVDDKKIQNELSLYSISDKLRRASSGVDNARSGRNAPVEGHHTDSVVSSQQATPIYPTQQSARAAATAQSPSRPRAAHQQNDSSNFLTNIRETWGTAGSVASTSEGSFIHSPGGAFVREPPTGEMRSPQNLQLFTSQTVQSLIYSDEDDRTREISMNVMNDEEEVMRLISNEDTMLQPKNVYSGYRWIMLFYMSVLNIISGWTCYSVAPIAEVVRKTLQVEPEYLVALFYVANVFASALVPAALGRFGLRRTVLIGSLLLMIGSMIKGNSTSLKVERLRVYIGFFVAGLSTPFYHQSTPALLSMSWFPKHERTLAKNVSLYSNQLGIGLAFIFGTLLVSGSNDIQPYFHLLSTISGLIFVGVALQFSDCPTVLPSGTCRIIRGVHEKPIFRRKEERRRFPSDTQLKALYLAHSASRSTELAMEQMEQSYITTYGSIDDTNAMKSTPPIGRNDDTSNDTSSPFLNLRRNNSENGKAVQDYYSYHFDQSFDPTKHLPPAGDTGRVDPILIQTPRYLDVIICDNQLWISTQACFSKQGFTQCLLAYIASGATINTLSTYLGYLVTSDSATQMAFVGIVGGSFQILSIITASMCERHGYPTQKYYMTIIALLAIGGLTLAICACNLDAADQLWWNLLMIAVIVSPIQPLSRQLG